MTDPEEHSPALGGDRAQSPPPPPPPPPEPEQANQADAAEPDLATIFGALLGEVGIEGSARIEINQSIQEISHHFASFFGTVQQRMQAVDNIFDAVENALEPLFREPPSNDQGNPH
ncbi:MAG: hypothetical protein JWM80_4569 [Cyanobacteria bacterium RYN_339]|nr:hypothetical protein [Cyanobacteria bacterium RYN_339]